MKYDVIYADPPWSYKDANLPGKRSVIHKYSLMSAADLEAMPVAGIAAKDCALFMWVTMPKLAEGLRLIDAWGFTFKTTAFTWVKRNRKSPSWFFGMGRWTRGNAELCLLATKGKPKRGSAGISSIIDTPIEAHSKKPDIVRDKISELIAKPRGGAFAKSRAFCPPNSTRLGFLGQSSQN